MNEKENQTINTTSPQSYIEEGASGKPVELTKDWVLEQIKITKEGVLKDAKEDAKIKIDQQVQTDKASLITVFGIFASVISFLTIEFQFLKTICSVEKILGFTFILFSLLFSFNIALDYLVKSRLEKGTPKPNIIFMLFIIILLFVGIIFSWRGNEEICTDNKIYQKYSDDFENKVQELNDNNNQKFKTIDTKLENMNNKINNQKQ